MHTTVRRVEHMSWRLAAEPRCARHAADQEHNALASSEERFYKSKSTLRTRRQGVAPPAPADATLRALGGALRAQEQWHDVMSVVRRLT